MRTHYEREPGYFLGSIYVNYGLTALAGDGILFRRCSSPAGCPPQAALWIVAGFAVVFPLWFFRYARSLWLGFDHYWDPLPDETREARTKPVKGVTEFSGRPTAAAKCNSACAGSAA